MCISHFWYSRVLLLSYGMTYVSSALTLGRATGRASGWYSDGDDLTRALHVLEFSLHHNCVLLHILLLWNPEWFAILVLVPAYHVVLEYLLSNEDVTAIVLVFCCIYDMLLCGRLDVQCCILLAMKSIAKTTGPYLKLTAVCHRSTVRTCVFWLSCFLTTRHCIMM